MKQIDRHLYALIEMGCKTFGTRNPEVIMPFIEESLTVTEYRTIEAFLQWSHDNNKPFGHGNYNERFAEWRKEAA